MSSPPHCTFPKIIRNTRKIAFRIFTGEQSTTYPVHANYVTLPCNFNAKNKEPETYILVFRCI